MDSLRNLWSTCLPRDADWQTLSPEDTVHLPETEAAQDLVSPSPFANRFSALEEIAQGGMGTVFSARQASLGRRVALKSISARHPRPGSCRSFLAEAQITGRLDHPNIVPVHDLAELDGRLFLAMKLVEGRSWSEVLEQAELPLNKHLEILLQVGNAVAFAHSRGIAHCDLKPANVLLGAFGEVLVVDWGVAVSFRERGEDDLRPCRIVSRPCGTPAYMPPELAHGRGRQIGPWTDVYLLGALLCRVLTGKPPHQEGSFEATVAHAAAGELPALGPDIPRELRAVCLKALSADPEQRHASVADFQRDVRAFLTHKESIALCDRAESLLEEAEARLRTSDGGGRRRVYGGFAEAIAGFQQALALWTAHDRARSGCEQARRRFATIALRDGDLGLAEAQAAELEDAELAASVRRAQAEKLAETRSRRRLRQGLLAATASALVLLFGGVLGLSFMASALRVERDLVARHSRELETQKLFAERRGAIAESALVALASEVRGKLRFGLGTPEARAVEGEILAVALRSWRALRAADYDAGRVDLQTARTHLAIASVLLESDGRIDDALAELQSALPISTRLLAEHPEDAETRFIHAHILQLRARLALSDRIDQSEAELTRALQVLAESPAPTGPQRLLQAQLLSRLSFFQLRTGEYGTALQSAMEAVHVAAEQAPRSRAHAYSLAQRGQLLGRLARPEEGLRDTRQALEIGGALSVDAGRDLSWQRDLAAWEGDQGVLLLRLRRHAEAAAVLDSALGRLRGLLQRNPASFELQRFCILMLRQRIEAALLLGETQLATQLADEALPLVALSAHAGGRDGVMLEYSHLLAMGHAKTLVGRDNLEDSGIWGTQRRAALLQELDQDMTIEDRHNALAGLNEIAFVLLENGQLTEAEEIFTTLVARVREDDARLTGQQAQVNLRVWFIRLLLNQAYCLEALTRWREAAESLAAAESLRTELLEGGYAWAISEQDVFLSLLSRIALRVGKGWHHDLPGLFSSCLHRLVGHLQQHTDETRAWNVLVELLALWQQVGRTIPPDPEDDRALDDALALACEREQQMPGAVSWQRVCQILFFGAELELGRGRLDGALARMTGLLDRCEDPPESLAGDQDLLRMQQRALLIQGELWGRNGDGPGALTRMGASLKLARELLSSGQPWAIAALATALEALASAQLAEGDAQSAAPLAEEACQQQLILLRASPRDADQLGQLLQASFVLASCLEQGEPAAAAPALRTIFQEAVACLSEVADGPLVDRVILQLAELAAAFEGFSAPVAGEVYQAAATLGTPWMHDGLVLSACRDLAVAHGVWLRSRGQTRAAQERLIEAATITRRLIGLPGGGPGFRGPLAALCRLIAELQGELGELEAARESAAEAVALRRLLAQERGTPDAHSTLANALQTALDTEVACGNRPAALGLLRELVSERRLLLEADPSPEAAGLLAECLIDLGQRAFQQDAAEPVDGLFDEALECAALYGGAGDAEACYSLIERAARGGLEVRLARMIGRAGRLLARAHEILEQRRATTAAWEEARAALAGLREQLGSDGP